VAFACGSDGQLYSATVADFSSRDPLIYSRPLRSEQLDSQWLNGQRYYDYTFVSGLHVYLPIYHMLNLA